MTSKLNELKKLKMEVAIWKEQAAADKDARINAAMNGRRHNDEASKMIAAKLADAESELACFEFFNADAVETLNNKIEEERKTRIKSAMRS